MYLSAAHIITKYTVSLSSLLSYLPFTLLVGLYTSYVTFRIFELLKTFTTFSYASAVSSGHLSYGLMNLKQRKSLLLGQVVFFLMQ